MKLFFVFAVLMLTGAQANGNLRALEGDVPLEEAEMDNELLMKLLDTDSDAEEPSIDVAKCHMIGKDTLACGDCAKTGRAAEMVEASRAGKDLNAVFERRQADTDRGGCDIVIKGAGRRGNRPEGAGAKRQDGGERQLSTCTGFVFAQSMCIDGQGWLSARAEDTAGNDDEDSDFYNTPYNANFASLTPATSVTSSGYAGIAKCHYSSKCTTVVDLDCDGDIYIRDRTGWGQQLTGRCKDSCTTIKWN